MVSAFDLSLLTHRPQTADNWAWCFFLYLVCKTKNNRNNRHYLFVPPTWSWRYPPECPPTIDNDNLNKDVRPLWNSYCNQICWHIFSPHCLIHPRQLLFRRALRWEQIDRRKTHCLWLNVNGAVRKCRTSSFSSTVNKWKWTFWLFKDKKGKKQDRTFVWTQD